MTRCLTLTEVFVNQKRMNVCKDGVMGQFQVRAVISIFVIDKKRLTKINAIDIKGKPGKVKW